MNRLIIALKGPFGRYLVVGFLSALVEMLGLILLVEKMGLSYLTGNAIAFVFTNTINYILSRFWVFERSGIRKRVELPIFIFFLLLGLGISQSVLWAIVTSMQWDYRLAKVISIGLVVCWNFITRRYIVFKREGLLYRKIENIS